MKSVSIAAIGSVNDASTFSGTPYHFWATAQKIGYDAVPWEMDLTRVNSRRKTWNIQQLLKFRKPGGFQYSDTFANMVLDRVPGHLLSSNVISFNQHFPPATAIAEHNGRIFHYIDATFSQLADRYGVGKIIGQRTVREIKRKERDFFERAEHIFTMQQWALNSVIDEYGISRLNVTAVLPGANIMFPDGYTPKENSRSGFDKDNPLVLGFVGKDWKRKGLPILSAVRDELIRRNYYVVIKCAGYAPDELKEREGIEFTGFIDKNKNYRAFIDFLESCDIGCLFSEAEFSSISVLEFISVGRPVAGFVVDGMGDLFMPDVSLRFSLADNVTKIADGFERYITDSTYRNGLSRSAVSRSSYVRWDRSVKEVMSVVTK